MSAPTLITVPTKKLVPSTDNPRGEIDRSGEEFAGLCVSIKAVGLVQPILVAAANGNGKHTILDGHRRHAAALEEKIDEIPVLVLADGVSEKIARLTANIQREDFSPVAEARAIKELQDEGLTQVQAADSLGKSERWVRERLRLLRLPAKTQGAYDAGALPLESLVPVEKVAEQAPQVAEALAKAAEDDEGVRKAVGADNVPGVLNHLIVEAAEKPKKDGSSELGCLVQAGDNDRRRGQVTYEALVLAGVPHDQLKAIKDQLKEWRKLADRLKRVDNWAYPRDPDPMWLDVSHQDDARKFGCLLEIDGSFYITDAAWLADRFLLHVQDVCKKVEGEIESAKGKRGSKSKAEKGSPEDEKAAKEERKRQREAEQQKRDEIRANNLELGQRAERALRSAKLSLDEAKLLALLVVGNNAEGLGARGVIYCYHDYQDEEQLKNGRTKVTYETGRVAGADLLKAIAEAKKPEEALGLALRAFVLSAFADQDCVAPSKQSYFKPRHCADDGVEALIQKVALDRQVLPDAVRQALAEQRQVEAEEVDLSLLATAQASRAKAGMGRPEMLEQFYMVTEAAIDELVEAKLLKEHGDDEKRSYTITAAGKKRLEKLRAAEKERQRAE